MTTDPSMNDILQKFTQEYQQTIPEKMATLRQILDEMKVKITVDNLKAFRFNIHKIAGSAGTYGYGDVSKLCRELELDLINKMEWFEQKPPTAEWLQSFETYFEKIKKGFSYDSTKPAER